MSVIIRLSTLVLSFAFCVSCGGNKITDDGSDGPTVVTKKKKKPSNTSPVAVPGDDSGLVPVGADGLPLAPPDHIPVIDPDFPGLDTALVPAQAPIGCAGGYDPETKQVSLTLNEETPGVRLHVSGGRLFANEAGCTLEDGSPLLVSMLRRISTKGGPENNALILDLAGESFGTELFVNEGGFHADLSAGADQLLVRGSRENDDIFVGSATQRLMLALSSMARINVWVKGAEYLTVSLGPGDDSLLAIQRLNVGLYDVDSGASLNVKNLSVPLRAWGGDGADGITGSDLSDFLSGGAGDDTLSGLGGNDFFDEGTDKNGADTLNGGEGLDEISYRWRSQNLNITLCQASADEGCPATDCDCTGDNGEESEGDRVVNFEIVRSGSGDDTLTGSAGDDYLYGQEGNDVLRGGDGSDVLQGGVGIDDFAGGEQGDICDNDPGEPMVDCEI